MTEYPWAQDAIGSWRVAIEALRERGVREGRYAPRNATEARWQAEGVRPVSELEAGRG